MNRFNRLELPVIEASRDRPSGGVVASECLVPRTLPCRHEARKAGAFFTDSGSNQIHLILGSRFLLYTWIPHYTSEAIVLEDGSSRRTNMTTQHHYGALDVAR